jgi:hypothetical protein
LLEDTSPALGYCLLSRGPPCCVFFLSLGFNVRHVFIEIVEQIIFIHRIAALVGAFGHRRGRRGGNLRGFAAVLRIGVAGPLSRLERRVSGIGDGSFDGIVAVKVLFLVMYFDGVGCVNDDRTSAFLDESGWRMLRLAAFLLVLFIGCFIEVVCFDVISY